MSSPSATGLPPMGGSPAAIGTESGAAASPDTARWLVVTAGTDRWAIPVAQVREVVRAVGIRRVPGAPDIQAGVVNVRGAIVTVLDLAALHGARRAVAPASIVLLQHGMRAVGLAVDTVLDVRGGEGNTPLDGDIPILNAIALCARFLHLPEETSS